jgi:hypothetical protein
MRRLMKGTRSQIQRTASIDLDCRRISYLCSDAVSTTRMLLITRTARDFLKFANGVSSL